MNWILQILLAILIVMNIILLFNMVKETIQHAKEDKCFWKRMEQEQEAFIAKYDAERKYYENLLATHTNEHEEIK